MLIFPLILLDAHLRAAGTPLDFIFIFELMTTIGARHLIRRSPLIQAAPCRRRHGCLTTQETR